MEKLRKGDRRLGRESRTHRHARGRDPCLLKKKNNIVEVVPSQGAISAPCPLQRGKTLNFNRHPTELVGCISFELSIFADTPPGAEY